MTKNRSSIWNLLRGFGTLSHKILYFLVIVLTGVAVIMSQNQRNRGQFNEITEAYYPLLREYGKVNPTDVQNKFRSIFIHNEFSKVGFEPSKGDLVQAVKANQNKNFSEYQKKQAAMLDWAEASYEKLNDNQIYQDICDKVAGLLTGQVVTEVEGKFYIIDTASYGPTSNKINESFVERGCGEFNPRYLDPEERSGAIVDSGFPLDDAKFLFNTINEFQGTLSNSSTEGKENISPGQQLIPKSNCVLRIENNRISILDSRGRDSGNSLSFFPKDKKKFGRDLPDGLVIFDGAFGSFGGKTDDLFFSGNNLAYVSSVRPTRPSTKTTNLPGVVEYHNKKVLAQEICRQLNKKNASGSPVPPLLKEYQYFPFKIHSSNPEKFQVIDEEDLIGIVDVESFTKKPKKISITLLTLEKILKYWQSHQAM